MSGSDVFDSLAAGLSQTERSDLLHKITASNTISSEPFLLQTDPGIEVDLEYEYEKLGLVMRIIIFFRTLFQGKAKEEIVEKHLTKKISRRLQIEYPGVIDEVEETALTKFYQALQSLQNIPAVFLQPLRTAFDANDKEFIPFFAGFQLEILHHRIAEAVDPFRRQDSFKDMDLHEILITLKQNLEELLADIPESDKQLVGSQLYALTQLHALSLYPFPKVLENFSKRLHDGGYVCKLDLIIKDLAKLMKILINIPVPPESSTLVALFLYLYKNEKGRKPEELDEKLGNQIERCKTALQSLREFHRAVPLVDILKYSLNNINYFPESEERRFSWFIRYRNYWEERLEKNYRAYVTERTYKQYIAEAARFLGEPVFPYLPNYRGGTHSPYFVPKYQHTLGFLYRYIKYYISIHFRTELQTILIDGEFYKDQNREEFTEAFNSLFQLEEFVNGIEHAMSAEGESGRQIRAVEKELMQKGLKKKKMAVQLEEIEGRIGSMTKKVVASLSNLSNIIKGILYGEVGGKYDTLANLSYFGGSDNRRFKGKLDSLLSSLTASREHIEHLTSMEL